MKLIFAAAATISIALTADRFDHIVRNNFFLGFTGNEKAFEAGMKTAEETLAENPKHPEALVWHGAGLFFRSGKLFQKQDFQNAVPLYERGLAEMDQAVALSPDRIGVRVPRGSALMGAARNIKDPARARPLLERAASDFQRVYDIQQRYLDKLGDHPLGELLMGLADTYYRLGDETKAAVYFEKLLAIGKVSGHEEEAKEWLATRKLSKPVTCVGCHVSK